MPLGPSSANHRDLRAGLLLPLCHRARQCYSFPSKKCPFSSEFSYMGWQVAILAISVPIKKMLSLQPWGFSSNPETTREAPLNMAVWQRNTFFTGKPHREVQYIKQTDTVPCGGQWGLWVGARGWVLCTVWKALGLGKPAAVSMRGEIPPLCISAEFGLFITSC